MTLILTYVVKYLILSKFANNFISGLIIAFEIFVKKKLFLLVYWILPIRLYAYLLFLDSSFSSRFFSIPVETADRC